MTKLSSPRWIIWVSNREEDKLLDIHSTVETIRVNELDEYVHEVFICDPGSGSYQDILNDPLWGNKNAETLVSKIDISTKEWNQMERETQQEMEEFRVWKENNKTIPVTEKQIDVRVENSSRVRSWVTAKMHYKVGGLSTDMNDDNSGSIHAPEANWKSFLDQGGFGTRPDNDTRKND